MIFCPSSAFRSSRLSGLSSSTSNSNNPASFSSPERLLTVDVGEYCAKKVLGACLQKKHTY
ncbi:conjugal transfer protein TraN, partial [Serratia sp. CY74664]|uniref:conjugal transfer protein TraN n=1 Tax=Serratia sp. CY74664 TaxID=3383676 RepID=UPI003FA0190E